MDDYLRFGIRILYDLADGTCNVFDCREIEKTNEKQVWRQMGILLRFASDNSDPFSKRLAGIDYFDSFINIPNHDVCYIKDSKKKSQTQKKKIKNESSGNRIFYW